MMVRQTLVPKVSGGLEAERGHYFDGHRFLTDPHWLISERRK